MNQPTRPEGAGAPSEPSGANEAPVERDRDRAAAPESERAEAQAPRGESARARAAADEGGRAHTRDASPSGEDAGGGDGGDADDDDGNGDGGDGAATTVSGAPRKRRRGRRGGKRHRKKTTAAGARPAKAAGEGEEPADDTGAVTEDAAAGEGEQPAAAKATAPSAHPRTPRPRQPRSRPPRAPRSAAARGATSTEKAGGDEAGEATATEAHAADESAAPARERAPAREAPAREVPALTDEAAAAEERADALSQMEGVEAGAEAAAATGAPRKRRRRGGRGRGGKKTAAAKTAANGEAATQEAEPAAAAAAEAKPAPRQRKPRERKPAETAARPTGSTRLDARAQRRQRQPQRRRRLTEEEARALRGEAKTMLIHKGKDRTQVSVLENRVIIENHVSHDDTRRMVGNIYLGRVQNVIAGMEAAFVDLGHGRNAVLYAGEVNYSAEDLEGDAQPRIEKVLRSGQSVLVQVTKDPIGTKGARLTSQISLPGRYLVLAPEQRLTGISRRLHEDERARLRQALRDIRPEGHGVIVRTAAEGASKEALKRDLDHLVKQWDELKRKQKKAKAPALLMQEPEMVMRVVRDIFSGDFERVVTDDREIYEQLRSYLEEVAPDLLDKLDLYEGELPMLEGFHVTEQIHKALERKVWLPSGGSIVIDRTEAMTVIDVNTGRFIGKGGSLEDTVYKNNLEAAEEIARQLRLRDIGGIIVIDFIDMLSVSNRLEVLRTLKRALARDKTRSQVSDEVSKLGLVEMTRKRSSEGLLEAYSETCSVCEGRGIVITHEID